MYDFNHYCFHKMLCFPISLGTSSVERTKIFGYPSQLIDEASHPLIQYPILAA